MSRKTLVFVLAASSLLAPVCRADTSAKQGYPIARTSTITEAEQRASTTTLGPREFGTLPWNIMQIPAAAFTPEFTLGADFSWQSGEYFGPTDGTTAPNSSWLWAPLILPTGIKVGFMNLYYKDTNAGADVTAELYKLYGEDINGLGPATTQLIAVNSSGSSGYGYAIGQATNPFTINNNSRWDPNGEGGKYVIEVDFQATTGLSFSGVDIYWQRQISPAPLTATFTDVPTTHTFFQYVEALMAAGITTGTTPTTFCPDAVVTRGQMAAFLARALGLHWMD